MPELIIKNICYIELLRFPVILTNTGVVVIHHALWTQLLSSSAGSVQPSSVQELQQLCYLVDKNTFFLRFSSLVKMHSKA